MLNYQRVILMTLGRNGGITDLISPTNQWRKGCYLKERHMNNDWNVILQKHMNTCHTWRCWCVLIGNSSIVSIHLAVFLSYKTPEVFGQQWGWFPKSIHLKYMEDGRWSIWLGRFSPQLAARIYVAGCAFGYTETYHGKLLGLVDALYNIIYYIYIYLIIYYPCLEMFTVLALLWPFTSYKYWITVTPMYNPIERTSYN